MIRSLYIGHDRGHYQMYNVELFKEPLEYAISLELENNVYQFQLRHKRRNENPLLAFRSRLS